jgi:patched 2 protein
MSSSVWTTRLSTTEDYVDLIDQVRFETEATYGTVPAFPMGTPFVFWEQYVTLNELTLFNVLLSIVALFIVSTINFAVAQPPHQPVSRTVRVALQCALIMCFSILVVVVMVAGSLNVTGIHLNSISMLSLLTTVGMGNEFTAHIVLSFIAASGTNDLRVEEALQHMFVPILGGFIS